MRSCARQAYVIDTARIVCGVDSMKRSSVRLSVCLYHRPTTAAACGGFTAAFHCQHCRNLFHRTLQWLGSRVISELDSGAEGPGFKSQPRRCRVTVTNRQTVHTHCAPVHQAAKLVAALLMVARVTAGLAESNGSLPPGL